MYYLAIFEGEKCKKKKNVIKKKKLYYLYLFIVHFGSISPLYCIYISIYIHVTFIKLL